MKDIVKKVFEYSAVNDQIVLVRCHGQNFNTMIIQFRFMFQPLMLKKTMASFTIKLDEHNRQARCAACGSQVGNGKKKNAFGWPSKQK